MSGKIILDSATYPSDQAISDLIRAGKISRRKVQAFLKERGLFVNSDNIADLALMVSTLFLDQTDISELLGCANTKESRLKSSTSEFSSEKDTIESIFERLEKGELQEDVNLPVRLSGQSLRPVLDLENRTITLRQPFVRRDFTKTALLQTENHEFTVRLTEKSSGSFELDYATSDVQSESYAKQIREKLQGPPECTRGYLHEVRKEELEPEEINLFFDLFLKSDELGCRLISAKRVALEKGEALILDQDTTDELAEDAQALAAAALSPDDEDVGNESRDEATIRYVTLDGKDLLNHSHVRTYRSDGYNVKSVTALFKISKYTGAAELELLITVSFNQFGKFIVEINKCWQVIPAENNRRNSWNLNPSEKQHHLGTLNRAALSIFDGLMEKKRAQKTKSPKANEVPAPAAT